MALVKCEVMGEIRVIFIDQVRLVDGAAIEQCYREIVEALDKTEERNVLLHFGRVVFLSSSALGMLIRVKKRCLGYKIMLKLCNIAPDIYEVFKITGLYKVFDICRDAAEALEAFKEGGHLYFPKRRPPSYEVT
jgi:anti-anti-sigma factor